MASRYKKGKESAEETSVGEGSSLGFGLVSKYKKYIILAAIMIIFLLLAGYTYKLYVLPATHTREVSLSCDFEQGKALEKLNQLDKIEQTFYSKDDELSGFSLKFAAFQQVSNGVLRVSLKEAETGELLFDDSVAVNEIADNAYREFRLKEPLKGRLNQKFSIIVELLESDENTKISLWTLGQDAYPEGKLFFNGIEMQRSDICFRVTAGENLFLKPMYLTAIGIIFLALIGIYYLAILKKLKIEHLFLITALFLGICYMMLFTPFSAPDEDTHIGSSYKYSNAVLGYGFSHDGVDYIREGDFAKVPLYRTPNADTYRYVGENLFTVSNSTHMEEIKLPYAGNACQYIFSAAGITIARFLNLGYLPMLMLGRLFNFAFFIGLSYIAIKRIPFGKMIMCSVSLMPMTMSLAISFSYDSVINTLAIFFIATVLYICYSESRVRWWDIALLCASGGLLVAAKAGIYIFICLMVLMIPMKRFKRRTGYFTTIALILASCAVFMIAFNLVNVINASTQPNKVEISIYSEAKATYSVGSIIHYPLNFIKTCVNTINEKFGHIFMSMIGYRLLWINLEIPSYLVYSVIGVLILSCFKVQDEPMYINKKNKIWLIIIVLSVLLALFIVAYTWTPEGSGVVEGLQGRYFIPILPIAMLIIRNDNLTFRKNIDNKLMYSLFFINILIIIISFQKIISGSIITII